MTAAPASGLFSLTDWLSRATQLNASDAHFHSGYPPLFRLNGKLTPMSHEILTDRDIRAEVIAVLSQEEKKNFETRRDADFTFELPAIGRYRGSIFLGQSGVNANFRVLAPRASTLQELGLPAELARFTEFHHGLLLVTGPAGCGKSTTLAALINLLNETHKGAHILTLEDPIEIIHKNNVCIVNQRQVPLHTQSYARAMRAALREDPDVIVVGEMRDAETISLAMTAAETGHLVMASMHTTDAVKSITRVVDSFPPDKQAQVRTMLAESLQAVFSQLLLPSIDGKSRALAYELLFVNSAIANMIKDKKTFQIPGVMQTGRAQGMMTFGLSLGELVRSGKVSRDVAKKYVEEAYF
jgi:twitching motility protein PilT